MDTTLIRKVYVDGGVVRVNPSPFGGTWAVIFLGEHDAELERHKGLVTPKDAGLAEITNNYTELLAAVEAMERLPPGWAGTIYTDSNVTRCRLLNSKPGFKNIPQALRDRTWAVRDRLGMYGVVLLDGHPSQKQLSAGIGKRGNPVSSWNVRCDEMCQGLARKFLADHPTVSTGSDRENHH